MINDYRLGLNIARLIFAKLFFKFEVETVDKKLDWVGKTRFRSLWDKGGFFPSGGGLRLAFRLEYVCILSRRIFAGYPSKNVSLWS